MKSKWIGVFLLMLIPPLLSRANLPGGGTGAGPDVTLTSSQGAATMSNGIVSIICSVPAARITQINYTYDNGSGTTTTHLLEGGHGGGSLYWEFGGFAGSPCAYSVVVDPAVGDANHPAGSYGEIDCLSTSKSNGTVDIHFSMLRGSPGFYVTAIWSHRAVDAAMAMGETRSNIYAGSIFNWMSVDSTRNRLMNVLGTTSLPVKGAPKECTLWTSGIYNGQYEDKYKFSADFGTQRVWGWSSVSSTASGATGKNVGLWDVTASPEYYNGGPMKRELMCHMGTTILNMMNGGHYCSANDGKFAAGEVWSKTYGPYFVYCNNISPAIIDPVQASSALYADALAQAAAEGTAWPYGWFDNSNYTPASGRGAVTGRIVINDSGNPNASAADLWVGVVQQPSTTDSVYDFQVWMKPYQFWVKTNANGEFTIPNVIAGTNYTLYAFGTGAEGTLMSQNQLGGNPPLLYNLPSTPFNVPVTGGSTTTLGAVTWTPTRVGPTVFEIGYPDRTARKFRHGDDYWVGDIGPSPSNPSPVWTKFLEYPFDFPNGMNYIVGTSRWTTDWNFIQPVTTVDSVTYSPSTGTITFNLASAPPKNALASLYVGLTSAFRSPTIISVNGANLGHTPGVTSVPAANSVTGYRPEYFDDASVREGINSVFTDERITFPAGLLVSGTNTISIDMTRGGYFANHIMYDYIRLELQGYVPPPPPGVKAYAGNNAALVCWPVVPGATSYHIFRSTTSGSGYASLADNVTGPVCGSGPVNATYLDTTAVNGTTYDYVVQSVNPTGASPKSTESAPVAPSSAVAASAPDPPTGMTAIPGNRQVALSWTAPAGANYYTVQRSTLVANGGGTNITLSTITLTNNVTDTTYTDTSPTNGSIYSYQVMASNAGGTSASSTAATAVPVAVTAAAQP